MKIPKYWAKKSLQVHSHPSITETSCWGYSLESMREAEKMAEEKVMKAAERLSLGKMPDSYFYSDRPMREEIIEEKVYPESGESYVITRNSYGALVLNSAKVMFVDIDEIKNEQGFIEKILSIIGLKKAEPIADIYSRINSLLSENPGWGLRLYETFKGYRLIVTHDLFDPTDKNTTSRLEKIGADSLYLKLCNAQESFRARLSPKPWRMGMPVPPGKYPRESHNHEIFLCSWLPQYDKLSANFSICRFIGEFGAKNMHREVEKIVMMHDELCKVNSALPLA